MGYSLYLLNFLGENEFLHFLRVPLSTKIPLYCLHLITVPSRVKM